MALNTVLIASAWPRARTACAVASASARSTTASDSVMRPIAFPVAFLIEPTRYASITAGCT